MSSRSQTSSCPISELRRGPTDLVDFVEAPTAYSPPTPASVRVADERFVVHAEQGGHWEHVQRIRLAGHDVGEAVETARAVMRETGATIASWWLSEHATPADVEERLLERGLTIVEGDYLIDGLLLTGAPPLAPAAVEARAIATEAELAEASELQYEVFAAPPNRRTRSHAEEFERLCGTEHERVYAAWVDGRVAGAARAYFTPLGAMMAGGATAPWARGRGAYRALVRARWDDAVARGTPALGVHANANSAPILRWLGFEQVLRFRRLQDLASSE